jgi:hypothetical protein
MRSEITVHGARPVVHRAGVTLWLSVPLADPAGTFDPSPTLTVFFEGPMTAAALGRELVGQAELAMRLLAIERAAEPDRPQEVTG